MLGNAGSGRAYPFLGVQGAHHELSHHQGREENFAALEIIDTWEVTQLASLLEKMDAVEEGDGRTLLDNTVVFFSSEIEDGNSHSHFNLPVLLAGSNEGFFKQGEHLRFSNNEPIAGLYAVGQNGLGGMILWSHGLHIAWAMTSGRLAGKHAMQNSNS